MYKMPKDDDRVVPCLVGAEQLRSWRSGPNSFQNTLETIFDVALREIDSGKAEVFVVVRVIP